MIYNDWRKGIEDSKYFICIVSKNYFNEVLCIEQALYAKSLRKFTILIIIEGTEILIPDLFENIVLKIEIKDAKELLERENEILKKISKILKK